MVVLAGGMDQQSNCLNNTFQCLYNRFTWQLSCLDNFHKSFNVVNPNLKFRTPKNYEGPPSFFLSLGP